MRVILTSGILYRSVIVGHMDRASEHQVFKQMGESGMVRIFIACAHIVQQVRATALGFVLSLSLCITRNPLDKVYRLMLII